MAITLGGRGIASSEINVTPLIDVLLVLLIIFMVLPHPSKGETAEIPRPPDKEAVTPPDAAIVIQLKDAGPSQRPTLKINDENVPWESLEGKLQEIYLRRIEKVAFLKGDPEIDFQFVGEVVDMTHHAGVTHVGLMGN